jgi:hypothetical protein
VKNLKIWQYGTAVAVLATAMTPVAAHAAQLSGDARASIPKDVQQIIVVDYKLMQVSPIAMQLKDRVLQPELKRLETALKSSGLQVDQDAETLAFAAFRDKAGTGTRIRQGQDQAGDVPAEPDLADGLGRHERGLSEPDNDGLRRPRGGEVGARCP